MAIGDEVAGYEDVTPGERGSLPPHSQVARMPPVSTPEIKSLLGIAVGVVVVGALYFGKSVLIPITLAVLLSFVLSPLVGLLQRLRLWRAPAVILAVMAALGVIGLIGTLIGSQASTFAANAPQYAQRIEAKVEGIQAFTRSKFASISSEMAAKRPELPGSSDRLRPVPPSPSAVTAGNSDQRPVPVQLVPEKASPFAMVRSILEPILGPLETTVIVLIVAIFVLMQEEDLRDRFIRVFGSSDLHRTTLAMDDAARRLSRYFVSQLVVNTGFGFIIGIGLWAIGIPAAAMWGVLAGLLRFVPYIGSFLAAIAPLALGAAIDPGWTTAIYVAILFAIVEPITGYVVEPLLYGHSTGLSPVSVIVAALFWAWLWGPIGLIISTPLTLCLVVMGRHVKSLEFFDVLLGDRPALTPAESFYQRILADNPDEALAQADALIEGRPLIAYYDDVVLKSVRLAVNDEARGILDRRRSAEMVRCINEVIEDLGDHHDSKAKKSFEATNAPMVACIAGRGAFDGTALSMLRQVLERRGISTSKVAGNATTRDAIRKLDLSGVSAIFLCHAELTGAPAHLRYLIKRFRQNASAVPIIVGFWSDEEAALTDTDIQRAIGADAYVRSLAEATASIQFAVSAEAGTFRDVVSATNSNADTET